MGVVHAFVGSSELVADSERLGKRSDVVRGKMGEGEGVPRVKRVWVDCGF